MGSFSYQLATISPPISLNAFLSASSSILVSAKDIL
jgi:hypothetical protein